MTPKIPEPPKPTKLWRGFCEPHHNFNFAMISQKWFGQSQFFEDILTEFLETQSQNHLKFGSSQIHMPNQSQNPQDFIFI